MKERAGGMFSRPAAVTAQSPKLRTLQTALRALQLTSSVILLAIYSYTLGALSNRSLPTPTAVRAVEGIVGISVAYAAICIALLRFIPTRTFPGFVLIVLDVAFAGAWIYVAAANRGGAGSCSGEVSTHFGKGDAGDSVEGKSGGFMALPSYGDACRLLTACLAISILTIFMFLGSISTTIFLGRDHHALKRKTISADPLADPTSYPPLDSPNPAEGPPTKSKFSFANMFRRRSTVRVPDTENTLPQHAQPTDYPASSQSFGRGDDYVHVNSAVGTAADSDLGMSAGRNGYQRVPVGHLDTSPYSHPHPQPHPLPASPETVYAEYDPHTYTPPPPTAHELQGQSHQGLWRPVDISGGARRQSTDLGEVHDEARFPYGPYENLRPASARPEFQWGDRPQPQGQQQRLAGYRYDDGVFDR